MGFKFNTWHKVSKPGLFSQLLDLKQTDVRLPGVWHSSLTVCVLTVCLGWCLVQVLSPTYKQRNEDFRKLFKQLPDTERLIVGTYCSVETHV